MSCESWDSNTAFDVVPVLAPDDYLHPVGLYLGQGMDYLTHPYASPLFGDLRGVTASFDPIGRFGGSAR